jgi:hypothetical protein
MGSLEREWKNNDSEVLISVDQRVCPKCRETTLAGRVSIKHEGIWKEMPELSFSTKSSNH